MKWVGGRSSSQGHRGEHTSKQVQHHNISPNSPVQVQIAHPPFPATQHPYSRNHKAQVPYVQPHPQNPQTQRHTSTSKPDAPRVTLPPPHPSSPHLLHLPPPTPLRSASSLQGAGAEAEQGHPQAGEQPRAVPPLEAAEDLRHVRLLDVEGVGASNEEGERDGGCAVGTLGPPRWVNEEERLVWSCLV